MKNKGQTVTCISITENTIKFVQSSLGQNNRRTIGGIQSISLSDSSEEEISRALGALLKDKKREDLGRVVLVIPRNLATLHYVRLPSVSEDEIAGMSSLQAVKQIPYEPQEIISAHQLIRSTAEGYSDVALVIIHQDIVNKYLRMLSGYNIEPQEAVIDTQGICGWFNLQQELKEKQGVIVIDMDKGSSRLDMIASGRFIYSRAFMHGSDSTQGYRMFLLEEIKKSLSAYEKENIGGVPDTAVFTGAQELLDSLDEAFMANFGFSCLKYNQGLNIGLDAPESGPQEEALRKNSFASLFGVAVLAQAPSFNLLPQAILERRRNRDYLRQIRKTAIISSLILFTIIAGMFLAVRVRGIKINRLNQELFSLSSQVSAVEEMSKKIAYIRGRSKQMNSPLDVLAEVYRVAGGEINLFSLSYSSADTLILKGQAQSLSGVFGFVNSLEQSPVFKDAQARRSSIRRVQERDIAEFEIFCQMEKK